MASQVYTNTPKVRLIWVAGALVLDPLDAESNTLLAEIFASDGALTTVAITQEDANRDGSGETGGFINTLKFVLTA